MNLTLSVLSIKGEAPFSSMWHTFDQSGGSVGRHQRADWVLLDEKKFLSGEHFKIHCDGKNFSIVDSSTNGTFINDSILPLGLDNSFILNDKDNIKIGEYIIIVSSISQSTEDAFEQRLDGGHSSTSPRDPFFSTEGHFNDSDSSKKRLNTNKQQQKSSFVDVDVSGSSDTPFKDPFFSTDGDSFSPDEDLLHQNLNDEVAVQPSFPIDINTPLRINSTSNKPEERSSLDVTKQKAEDEPDVFNFLDEKSTTQKHDYKEIPQERVELPIKHEVVKSSARRAISDADDKSALEHLLKGAGLNSKHLSSDMPIETFEVIGSALKEVLQGTIDLLKSRSEIKNHLHLDRTIINSVENNPLKFMPDAQQVILNLLRSEADDKTYLPLDLALEEAFDDIKAHQVAMTAAAEKALRGVIKQHFSPANLAENMAKTNPITAVIPVKRQAKLWSMFETLYEDVEEKATESFQRLLDHEMSKAYEEQLLEIKSLRNKNNNNSSEFPE